MMSPSVYGYRPMSLTLLRHSLLLRSLPPSALKRIVQIAKLRRFAARADIFSKADPADHMFIVGKGRVKISSRSVGRKRMTYAYLGPGEYFGEMALLDGKERSAAAQAAEACELLIINREDFRKLICSDPASHWYLLKTLCARLRAANEGIEGLLFRNVLGRLSKTLSDLGHARGKRFRGGLMLTDSYTKKELADLVGTTREPLSRALAALRRAAIVSVRHGHILLRDPRRLLIGEAGATHPYNGSAGHRSRLRTGKAVLRALPTEPKTV